MPFIGHRQPDLTDVGLSPATTPEFDPAADLHARAVTVVNRVSRDDADRTMLLEALGLARTATHEMPEAS